MYAQEASMDLTAMAMDQNQNMYKDDDKLRVSFSVQPNFNQAKTNAEGRPIYDDAEYITIMVPGQQDVVHRKAWPMDKARFARQYAAFQQKQDQQLGSGTPLKVLTWITGSQVKELEYFNVFTVEQLAGAPDNLGQKFMGFQTLKQRAADFLRAAKEAAPLTAMRAELEERDAALATAKNQIEEMGRRLEELEKASKAAKK